MCAASSAKSPAVPVKTFAPAFWIRLPCALPAALFLFTAAPIVSFAQTAVLTHSYNNSRTGANTSESILTPQKVSTQGLTRMRLPLPGEAPIDDPRIEAQPLYVPGLTMSDGKPHNVIFACSMGNSVYAFDADTGHEIAPYPISLGPAVPSSNTTVMDDIAYWGVNEHWGILSTPAIDIDSKTMYVINWTLEPDGQRVFRLNALDLATGKPRLPAQAIFCDYGEGHVYSAFDPNLQKQRAALLLTPLHQPDGAPVKKVLYMGCGETQEDAPGHHGWLIAFDTATLKTAACWCVTPLGLGGGIWQSGQGPAADVNGDVYVMTSNGDFDGYVSRWTLLKESTKAIFSLDFNKQLVIPMGNYSDCFVKLHYTPPDAGKDNGRLDVLQWWCPFRDVDRNGSVEDYNFRDQDLGSTGPVLMPGTNFVSGAGKDGILYTFDQGKLGNALQDYSVLKQNPPPFVTYDPPAGKSSTGDLDFFPADDKTHHLHGTPVAWQSPNQGLLYYLWGENEYLRAYHTDDKGISTLYGKGGEMTSGTGLHGAMPGGIVTLSATGTTPDTGIVWATTPIYGDSSRYINPGVLRAYDATELDPRKNDDGTPRLKLLWNSVAGNSGTGSNDTPAFSFDYDKFCPAVVADGKVMVATYDGHIDVYMLKGTAAPAAAPGQH
jgi:hypothetical protein